MITLLQQVLQYKLNFMKRILTIVSALVLLTVSSFAQNITGVVKDADGKMLANASVSLLNAKDSSVVKLALTNTSGEYHFININKGYYFTRANFVGYAYSTSPVFEVAGNIDINLAAISLAKSNNTLQDVVVTSKKPIVEVKADKTILNVENTINSIGSDALELLRKSPGVMVDKDDNISLSGKNGVKIYIDGRPSPLTGTDLSYYLKSIQSSQIESIEIITNPSAKYDAEGNAGIINIRLKKNKAFGTNGSINAGYNIGIYPKYNAGINFNHRDKNVNIFGSYSYDDNKNQGFMDIYRIQLDTVFDQHSKMFFTNKSHNFKAGMDYFINSKSTIGIMVNGTISSPEFNNQSSTIITYQPTDSVNRILKAGNSSTGTRDNINANLNYHFADKNGHELNVDADYGFYNIKSNQFQPNYYYDPTGSYLQGQDIYNMIAPTKIDIYSAKADYEQNFMKGKLGYGAKFSYVKTTNNFDRYNIYSNDKLLDTLRSNNFNYKENVNAAYVNYNRQYKGFMIQAGLRVENTNAEGISSGYNWDNGYHPYDSTFKRHYTDFFPSASITLNKNPKNQWGLAYSRRIDRPAYQDLNPFEFKLDEYTYQKGNTLLTPQYTNSISLTNTLWYRLTTKLSYSHVNDVFSQIIDTADFSKTFITKKNLATQDMVSLNISMPWQKKWYSVFANINSYYTHYKADFGTGRNIDLDVYAVNIYAQQTFTVSKNTTIEVSGFYTSPSIWQGTFKSGTLWSVDGGVQQKLLKGKAVAKLSVTDIFQTLRWSGTSNFAGQYLHVNGGNESRQLKLSFVYRFGSSSVKSERQRKTGVEDEEKRVGTQGGGLH